MKIFDKIWGVSEVSGRFPTVVSSIIAFPLNQILVLVTIFAAVENLFDFVFEFIFDLYWLWRFGICAVDIIASPGREAVDVEDRVLMH